jgi:predicted house-cleaning noncanonical NTP pyrophosphatase (MazG superfamily)
MPLCKKLVRDVLPGTIESTGKEYTIKILKDEEYIRELKNKCLEELEEYMKADKDFHVVE